MERKYLLLIVGISTAIIVVVALFFAAFFPTPQRVLKKNLYTKAFSDLSELLKLDVIIHYETETDGTWRRISQAGYNITVFVKLTYVNESVMSKLKVIYWGVGGIPISIWGGWVGGIPQSAPIDYGLDLMGFWFNQSAWRVGSDIYQPSLYSLPPAPTQDQSYLTYTFVIREILTNGTRNVFNVGDFISIPISG